MSLRKRVLTSDTQTYSKGAALLKGKVCCRIEFQSKNRGSTVSGARCARVYPVIQKIGKCSIGECKPLRIAGLETYTRVRNRYVATPCTNTASNEPSTAIPKYAVGIRYHHRVSFGPCYLRSCFR